MTRAFSGLFPLKPRRAAQATADTGLPKGQIRRRKQVDLREPNRFEPNENRARWAPPAYWFT